MVRSLSSSSQAFGTCGVDVEGDRAAVAQLAPAARGAQLVFTPTLPGQGLQVLCVGMARMLQSFLFGFSQPGFLLRLFLHFFISSLFFRVSA